MMSLKDHQAILANKLTLLAGQREDLRLQDKAELDLRWLESFSLLSPSIATGLYGPLKIIAKSRNLMKLNY